MKKYIILLFTILIGFSFQSKALAASPTFSIYPSKGKVTVNKTFTIDVLIDSAGNNITQARMVLLYDPAYLRATKTEYNASLFCTYPSDDQSVDNTNGVVMLSGFCQSGSDTLYKTTGGADVFARVSFQVKKAGTVKIDWNYNGKNENFYSVIMKDGSPPTNVLASKPATATFTTTTSVVPNNNNGGEVPNTGIAASTGILILGVLLIVLGIVYVRMGGRSKNKMKTVVLYD